MFLSRDFDFLFIIGADPGGFFYNTAVFVQSVSDDQELQGTWYQLSNTYMPSPREFSAMNVYNGAVVLFGLISYFLFN